MIIQSIAIDDEYLALDVIKEYAQKVPFLNLKKSFDSPLLGMEYLKQYKVDLVFLDIQMKDITGLQFVKLLSTPPLVILTTAYDKYAVESYELDVLDYLLKPISFERFIKSVEKAYDKLIPANINDHDLPIANNAENYFFVKSGTSLERVAFDEILYIKGERDYLKIVTKDRSILVLYKFKQLEELLPPDQFCRVHKSYMIAIDKIKKVDSNLIYTSKAELPIGATYRNDFLKLITNSSF